MAKKSKKQAKAFAHDARLFVIRLAGEDGVLGYAVAERVSFIDPSAAASNFMGFGNSAQSLEQAFKALSEAQAAEGVKADAAALPATLDIGGRGLTIGAPSRGAPSSPPSAESVRGAPAGPPDDDD